MGISKQQQRACNECTRKCLKSHGKKPSPSQLQSFFKIMIGDFDQAMFVPPKVAKSLGGLVGKYINLEDSEGNCWRVKISVKDGSLAFEQGWQDFVWDHSIAFGELVIFTQISVLLFCVQVFGTSGCERKHFQEQSNGNDDRHRRKRSKVDISPINLNLDKDLKTSEASKGKQRGVDKIMVRRDQEMQTVPCDLSWNQTSTGQDLYALQEYHECNNGYGKLSNASSQSIDGDAMGIEEAGRIPIIDLCNEEDLVSVTIKQDDSLFHLSKCGMPEKTSGADNGEERKRKAVECDWTNYKRLHTMEQKSLVNCPKELHNVVLKDSVCEEESLETTPVVPLVPDTFKSNGLTRCEDLSIAECTDSGTTNQVEASRAIIPYPLSEERMPSIEYLNIAAENHIENTTKKLYCGMVVTKLDDLECLEDDSRPQYVTEKCVEYEGGDLITPAKIAKKCLVTEEGICYDADEYLDNKTGVIRKSSTDLHVIERVASVSIADVVDIERICSSPQENDLGISCHVPVVSCTENDAKNITPLCNGFGTNSQYEGELGNDPNPLSVEEDISLVDAINSAPLITTDMSTLHKDPVANEAYSCQPGTLHEASPEVNEKVTPCLKGLGVVKTEIVDSSDLPLLTCASFNLIASVDSYSWLLLPERLPSRTGKRKLKRRIVVLRDPLMRCWPVLYHETSKFVGFVGGWEEFAKANNLQLGDTCEIEFSSRP